MSESNRRKSGVFVSKKVSKSIDNYKYFNTSQIIQTEPEEPEESEEPEEPVNSSNIEENVNDVPGVSWREGRRIMELGHLADQLNCTDCGDYLRLSNITQETRYGFGSLLYIDCTCGVVNTVETNKRHRVNIKGPKVFDINTKAALGMLHSGAGARQIENFMSVMEIPGLHSSSMKNRENEVAKHINDVAAETCTEALMEEVQLINNDESREELDQVPSGEFSYDMVWQKRGSGRCYDSKSGVGTLFGNKTGKIVAYDLRSKDCRKCSFHESKGQETPTHNCHKNWYGSSKAMEPDVGCSLVQEIESKNVQVGVMIMDDDATTMAKIKTAVSHPIIKWSDINHTKKNLGNNLYKLQSKHKCLNTKIIQWFQKCFSYAVCQNKDNPSGLAIAIKQIVPHAFGEHENCATWCKYYQNPDTYRHSSTPYGKDLTGEELRKDLNHVFEKFVANVEKIAPGASTKVVESFNNMLTSKAPKRCHYSASGSLKNRLSCTVAQKNSGCSYINKVNAKTGISPGTFYAKIAAKRDKSRVKRLVFENTKTFKKRKLDKKMKNKYTTAQKELREGTLYQSGIAMSNVCDITEIPAAITSPSSCKLLQEDMSVKVFCDVETTSLHKNCDIIQLAAVCENETFNHYIQPSQPVSQGASEVTGLTVRDNRMYKNGKPVFSETLKNVLILFLSWLQNRGKCILLGHNFRKFDLPRILRALEICKLLSAFQATVLGSVDTLHIYKSVYPELECYKQEYLVSTLVNVQYSAHDALADVESLQQLVLHTNINVDTLAEHSESTNSSVNIYKFNKICDSNKSTMDCLVNDRVVTKEMAKKIASSGLCLQHLQLAISRNGLDGLMQLFKEKSLDGKARVTSLKRIIENVFNYLQKF